MIFHFRQVIVKDLAYLSGNDGDLNWSAYDPKETSRPIQLIIFELAHSVYAVQLNWY